MSRPTQAHNRPAISATAVSKSYGQFVALKDVSLSIQRGEKIGLVGQNGAGKTTLMKILAGISEPDEGKVTLAKGVAVGYIPQDFSAHLGERVRDYVGRAETVSAWKRLNLPESALDRRLGELSGGEKTKVALARILLSDADLLLLDEPTNNLDPEGLEFLERFVRESDKAFLVVSHDRKFLDNTVSRVFEIDEADRSLRAFDGNYTEYREARAALIEKQWKDYADKVGEEKRLDKSFKDRVSQIRALERARLGIRKLDPKLSEKPDDAALRDKEAKAGRRTRAMKDRLERFREESAEIEKPRQPLPLNLSFDEAERSGDKVLSLKGLAKRLPHGKIGPLDLDVRYGDRVLISGPNGSGKTTLIRAIMGEVAADEGAIEWGAGVRAGYLPQEERLSLDSTVRDEFLKRTEMDESEARKVLNRFRLEAKDMGKGIGELSSGERSRLSLAAFMARKANCLVLDEPTNHLDLEALEALEAALARFKGTLIVASHDRYFIEKLSFGKELRVGSSI